MPSIELDKVIKQITEHPETWDQGRWYSGSALCVAGHVGTMRYPVRPARYVGAHRRDSLWAFCARVVTMTMVAIAVGMGLALLVFLLAGCDADRPKPDPTADRTFQRTTGNPNVDRTNLEALCDAWDAEGTATLVEPGVHDRISQLAAATGIPGRLVRDIARFYEVGDPAVRRQLYDTVKRDCRDAGWQG